MCKQVFCVDLTMQHVMLCLLQALSLSLRLAELRLHLMVRRLARLLAVWCRRDLDSMALQQA